MKSEKTITIFRASPRKNGNTNSLTDAVARRIAENAPHVNIREFDLSEMTIRPCTACRQCQKDWTTVGCPRWNGDLADARDDMPQIFEAVTESDLLILATPVYSWYCTPPMKAMLDRLVYAMNMYYGEKRGPSLWEGKKLALITTCGYPPEKGADLLEEGIRRYCKHSKLQYLGMLCCRHMGYGVPFMDEEKQKQAEDYADRLTAQLPG